MNPASLAIALLKARKPYPNRAWQRALRLDQGGPLAIADPLIALCRALVVFTLALLAWIFADLWWPFLALTGACGLGLGYVALVQFSARFASPDEVGRLSNHMEHYPAMVEACSGWFVQGDALRVRDIGRAKLAVLFLAWQTKRDAKAATQLLVNPQTQAVAKPPSWGVAFWRRWTKDYLVELKSQCQGAALALPPDMTPEEQAQAQQFLGAMKAPGRQWSLVVQRLLYVPAQLGRTILALRVQGTTVWNPRRWDLWCMLGMAWLTIYMMIFMPVMSFLRELNWFRGKQAGVQLALTFGGYIVVLLFAAWTKRWRMPLSGAAMVALEEEIKQPVVAWAFDQCCQDPAQFSQADARRVLRAGNALRPYLARKEREMKNAALMEATEALPAAKAARALQDAQQLEITTYAGTGKKQARRL